MFQNITALPPGLPNTIHIPRYDESGAPHYHLPMPSPKASGLLLNKTTLGALPQHHCQRLSGWVWLDSSMQQSGDLMLWHAFSGDFLPVGMVTPGQITMGGPYWIGSPGQQIKYFNINHRVACLGLNQQWDGKAAPFVATKNRGKFNVWEGG
jgi:hypothetical protein